MSIIKKLKRKIYNPFRPHIVRFRYNNKFALRKLTILGYEYLNIKHCGLWWPYNVDDCRTDDIKVVEDCLYFIKDKGEKV